MAHGCKSMHIHIARIGATRVRMRAWQCIGPSNKHPKPSQCHAHSSVVAVAAVVVVDVGVVAAAVAVAVAVVALVVLWSQP